MRLDRDQALMICDYCGSHAVPPADEDGVQVLDPSKYSCPACKEALYNGRIEQHDLLYCNACHGMLIPMDDVMPLVEELRDHRERPVGYLSPRTTEAEPTLSCPLCTHEMDHHAYGGGGNVMVDSCEQCSQLWLGRGELRKIASAADPEVLLRSSRVSSIFNPVYSEYGDAGQSRDDR